MSARTLMPIMHSSIPNIPWDVIAGHDEQAQRNHGGQTLEKLASRGGLSACEAVAIIEDRRWQKMNDAAADNRLMELVKQHRANVASPANTAAATGDEQAAYLTWWHAEGHKAIAQIEGWKVWQAARARPALADEPAHLCIAPACGDKCTDCSNALPDDLVRRNAIKYALVCKLDPRFGMPVEWLGFGTFDEAIERHLNGEKP